MRRILIGGDVLVDIDGRPLANQLDLNLIMSRKRPGDTISVQYYRGAQKLETKFTLGDANR
jgi:S1-C subfamily serine protease